MCQRQSQVRPAPGIPGVNLENVIIRTRTDTLTPAEYLKNLEGGKSTTDDLIKKKEGRVKLNTEHKLFIMKYMSRNQVRRFTAANVRDELHRVFGET